mgnify:CR=1 FL=1
MDDFTRYVLDFYGDGGIYDYGFTSSEVKMATELYKMKLAADNWGFCGDTIDRENVRDIVLHYRDVEFV